MNSIIVRLVLRKSCYLGLVAASVLILSSCASVGVAPSNYPTVKEVYPQLAGHALRQDIMHAVGPGETLWHIGKMYDVKVDQIMRANHLKAPVSLEMGQRLLIPGAAPLRPVIPLFRTNKWSYIIVHHSATDEGNALSLFQLHSRRGFAGLGYHFIIDNGTAGKDAGQIEVSPRWINQQDGAHCKASGMNHIGIGVCLVGNFSKEYVSQKQLDALVYLVNMLRKQYSIPLKNILGHGQVKGAKTECPGNNFPWQEFNAQLAHSQ